MKEKDRVVPRVPPAINGIVLGMRVRLKRGQTDKVGQVRTIAFTRGGPVQAHVVWEHRAKGRHASAWVALGNLRPADDDDDDEGERA